jgi:hypothetical protein
MEVDTMAFTPGPWKVDEPYRNEVYIDGANGRTVAFVTHNDDERKEQAADACLIAAAPDLLAACKALLEGIDEYWATLPEGKAAIDAARAAVARAEGREDQ